MVSELAKEDVADLAAKGIHLTADEVVRLNALGLKVEAGEDSADVCELPRVAFLGDVILREPTIAHEIWLDEAQRIIDFSDSVTFLAVHAYAYSRPAKMLPRVDFPLSKHLIQVLIKRALKTFAPFTMRQIDRALYYVAHGADHRTGEYPERKGKVEAPPEDVSVGVGVMLNGVSVALGLSLDDLGKLTRRQILAATDRALSVAGISPNPSAAKKRYQAEYLRTLDAIVAAHTEANDGK